MSMPPFFHASGPVIPVRPGLFQGLASASECIPQPQPEMVVQIVP